MNIVKKRLLKALHSIKGNGYFVTSGVQHFVHPGLYVEGIGELGFPLVVSQVKELIKQTHKAPFGRGSKTITITKGRPYTLRLTKTQVSYELRLKHWEEDMVLLKKIN